MNRLAPILPIMAVIIFIPLAHASALNLASHKVSSDSSVPLPSSVLAISSSISGTGLAGRYLFSRRQK